MKMIVGLGNPGKKYDNTRHNVGFELIGELAKRWQADRFRDKHQSQLAEIALAGEKVLLVAPQTFMNLSGVSVRLAADFYKLPPSDLLVVCDDFNLPLGTLRMRTKGSAGGQNGLDNIIQQLGTQDFARLRIGIGPVPERWSTVDFVLGKFARDEQELADQTIRRTADAVECWVRQGPTAAMNQFN
ncbi:aminoacyl-tRNA hydrolase [Aeoliella sp. ICT_H6.2]|uniref:Peptidyl-tRNA hydrolase n=1 Tax=Aeoliella straminimaris TaxID=2954799 RepID=A0A9X2F7R3_9BACT|nr:aminoacyl-tRNA hydrolase [Aeoliella straminimaris]MCO6043922.1 aminoacyl-tRNA hydrolase [Aeoliella straminimaris]